MAMRAGAICALAMRVVTIQAEMRAVGRDSGGRCYKNALFGGQARRWRLRSGFGRKGITPDRGFSEGCFSLAPKRVSYPPKPAIL
ncbi:hypothetical protein [Gordonibacter urolithinfaciens]|uniref:Uncharacterized protein n=1 Tax=Gordonibacter urolithinfaciens TaxID=1335613 RepID=A0A6N8IIB2_9ACTN|nr:hypothetical protein [Gordonibacter urolithinfaciens]MVM55251.1 hypothetical protein [Gordonibacter urolithinfaciens]MVN15577.1 hypothetical protein [Gordonibacter urolithinfaciens]MVN39069.1 hypothetical protein [Gordonibacter urolithinfaciens]MVN55540.1 hypothetical protein [Gordonibacter urolithinfaciens]